MDKSKIEDIYKLTPLQKGMLYHQLRDNDGSYFIQHVFRCESVDADKLRQSLGLLAQKHEILRTKFVYENVKEPVQAIIRNRTPELKLIDLSDTKERANKIQEIRKEDRARGFDLSNDPLLRIILITGTGDKTVMIFSIHHIIVDGWSLSIIFNDLDKIYKRLEEKTAEQISQEIELDKKSKCRFGDYVRRLQKTDMNEGIKYYTEFLDGYDNNSYIEPYYVKNTDEFTVRKKTKELSEKLTGELSDFCQKNGITVNTFVETVLGIILQDYTRSNDVVFGKVVSGRNVSMPGIETMTGMFINSLPQRITSSPDMKILDLLNNVSEQSIMAMNYDYVNLAEVQQKSGIGNGLVRILLTFENYAQAEAEGDYFFKEEDNLEFTNYDLSVIAYVEKKLAVCFIYKDNIYGESQIDNVLGLFEDIVAQIIREPDIKVSQLDKATQEEQDLILDRFNDTYLEYDDTLTMADMFEQQVKAAPDNTAVVFGNEKLTYNELNEMANKVAWRLREMGIGANDFVAILAKRSIQMVVGIYGVLKAGGAYVPIDITNPKERISFILNDCKPKVAVTFGCSEDYLEGYKILDLSDPGLLEERSDDPERNNNSRDLAYCIYTSGTTGKPKGVMVEHYGIANYRQYFLKDQKVGSRDNVLQFATYSFDTSIAEMSMALLTGATLHVISRDTIDDADELADYIEKNNITIAYLPPLYLNKIKLKGLRTIITAGSEASKDLVIKNSHIDVYTNEYGPTEATVCTTFWQHHKDEPVPEKIPIGKPLFNKKVYILQDNRLCGIGIPGELCIAGDGLARGYLNRQELTDEKFVKNPFGQGRMYYSGDVAKWLPDGNIMYLGRCDEQIKIRGFRIEVLEVEHMLQQIRGIKNCAVVARPDSNGENALFAYFVADETISVKDIRKELGESLPSYMIPSYIMQINEIPVTNNGKLDKRALAKIDIVSDREYIEPVTEMEKKLCNIFNEILVRKQTGIDEDFFELGGHSISALLLLSRIRMETNKKITMKDIFANPTVEGLCRIISEDGNSEAAEERLRHAQKKEFYEMSSAQKRMYFLWLKDKESISYNVPQIYKVKGSIDPDRIKDAYYSLVKRHEILRTEFLINEKGEPVQKISDDVNPEFSYIVEEDSSEDKLITDFVKPFDLSKPLPIRLQIVKRNSGCLLMIDMHHIVCDETSYEIFTREFCDIYNGLELKDVSFQYKDYSEWAKERDYSGQKKYWTDQFRNDIPEIALPITGRRDNDRRDQGRTISTSLSDELTGKLKKIASAHSATDNMLYVAVTMLLLHLFGNKEDIVLGIPISGRVCEGTENIMGMFVNSLALRGRVDDNISFSMYLDQIKDICIKAYENQEYPFEELVSELRLGGDMQNNPIFNVMMTFHRHEDEKMRLGESEIEHIDGNNNIVKFDLTFHVAQAGEGGEVGLEYRRDLFDDKTADRILKQYVRILDQIAENSTLNISDIEIISDEERDLIKSINDTYVEWDEQDSVIDMFEKRVAKNPDCIALIEETKKISYLELNQHANSLALRLKEKGVGKNDFVAIKGYRSIEMIIAILGTMKTGAAYIPVDPSSPPKREKYILEESRPKVVLLCKSDIETDIPSIRISFDDRTVEEAIDNPERDTDLGTAAYCIFTSGTTGKPKGVVIQHGALRNYINYAGKNYIDAEPVIPFFTNASFDLTVTSIYLSLCFGGTLIVFDDDKTILDVARDYHKHAYTFIKMTPEHLNLLIKADLGIKMPSLKTMVLGGEALKRPLCMEALTELGEQISIHNEYGPTEATVGCADYIFDPKDEDLYVSIGKPISNAQMYIANGNRMCGIGVIGELCISGSGLAKGYLNSEELTGSRFVKNPFGEGMLYHSGDLAKISGSGNLTYVGRVDEQIKIRGYRVETGEIEDAIRKNISVDNCFICARNNKAGEKDLYAYIVSSEEVDVQSLKHSLRQSLPLYMIPQYILQVSSIPMTQNGKVDKENLPLAEIKNADSAFLPRNREEELIYNIALDLLNIEEIGGNDNFFELGMQSMKAILMANRIYKETGCRIELKDIFTAPTISEIALLLKERGDSKEENIAVSDEKTFYIMSPLQKSLYLLWQSDKNSLAYNMPESVEIKGNVDCERLNIAFEDILRCHDILRTTFTVTEDGDYVQRIVDSSDVEISYEEDKESSIDELMRLFVRPFDLEKEIPIRMKLVKRGKDEFLLLLDKHHISSDGISNTMFWNLLIDTYNGKGSIRPKLQYRDYCEWIGKKDLSEQKAYWGRTFDREIPDLNLPTDYVRPAVRSSKGGVIEKEVPFDTREKIRKISSEFGVSLHMFFLSVFTVYLSRYGRQDDIVVGIPVNGRTNPDLENMIGMFANTLPILSNPKSDKVFSEYLKETKDILLKAYENQDCSFEEIVDHLDIKREMNRNPLFDVMLSMEESTKSRKSFEGTSMEHAGTANESSKFDLMLTVLSEEDKIMLGMEYSSDLWKEESVIRMMDQFIVILDEASSFPQRKICELEMITAEEKKQILEIFNDTSSNQLSKETIIDLFRNAVQRFPEKTAVVFEDRSMSYSELSDLANETAMQLIQAGVRPGDHVTLYTKRSIEMIAAIYAVLIAGGVYVPIDPMYPEERIRYILNDSKPGAMILYGTSISCDIPTINMESIRAKAVQVNSECKYDSAVYCLYTSGTTGTPKGIEIRNESVVNLCENLINPIYDKYSVENVALVASFCFDASVQNIFAPLISGKTLYIISDEVKMDANKFSDYIQKNNIQGMDGTPVHQSILAPERYEDFKLKVAIIGGDVISLETNKRLFSNSDLAIYNVYGPTECTVDVTSYECNADDDINVPIGKPITNTQIYITDHDRLCGIGVPGELCIGGIGLSDGYLNLDNLTREKFVSNPFGEGRIYKTGDLARWRADGNIQYIGRADSQVKINGFRIEIGEIENAILKIPQIRECAVIVREDRSSEKALFAYYASDSEIDAGMIKNTLSSFLPYYMVPYYYMQLDSIPVTVNGKVDRRKLPQITIKTRDQNTAATTKEEAVLLDIFRQILKIDDIGTESNVFEYGVNSMKLMQVVVMARNQGYSVEYSSLVKSKMITNMARYMKKI